MLGGVGSPAARLFHSVFKDQPQLLATALALMTSIALLTFLTRGVLGLRVSKSKGIVVDRIFGEGQNLASYQAGYW